MRREMQSPLVIAQLMIGSQTEMNNQITRAHHIETKVISIMPHVSGPGGRLGFI